MKQNTLIEKTIGEILIVKKRVEGALNSPSSASQISAIGLKSLTNGLKSALAILILLGLFSGCKNDATAPGGDNPSAITKSPKRGIAFDLVSEVDFAAI